MSHGRVLCRVTPRVKMGEGVTRLGVAHALFFAVHSRGLSQKPLEKGVRISIMKLEKPPCGERR